MRTGVLQPDAVCKTLFQRGLVSMKVCSVRFTLQLRF